MRVFVFLLIAILVGGLFPVQGAINTRLASFMSHPLHATFISFSGGVLVLIGIFMFSKIGFPSIANVKATPWLYLTGGLYGVLIVSVLLILTPKLGIANTLISMMAGQVIISVVLDHFGLLGLDVRPATIWRIVGCLGLVTSLYLIQRS